MKTRKPAIAIALLVIALGVAWLLNAMEVIPGVDWIWVVCLGVSGILLLALTKFDRFTFVVGASLIVSSVLSVLRQTNALRFELAAPVLFITIGVLLLCAQLLPLPEPPKEENSLPERDPDNLTF